MPGRGGRGNKRLKGQGFPNDFWPGIAPDNILTPSITSAAAVQDAAASGMQPSNLFSRRTTKQFNPEHHLDVPSGTFVWGKWSVYLRRGSTLLENRVDKPENRHVRYGLATILLEIITFLIWKPLNHVTVIAEIFGNSWGKLFPVTPFWKKTRKL